jgi:hypothetical protein
MEQVNAFRVHPLSVCKHGKNAIKCRDCKCNFRNERMERDNQRAAAERLGV